MRKLLKALLDKPTRDGVIHRVDIVDRQLASPRVLAVAILLEM
jgi:hypothetical protein